MFYGITHRRSLQKAHDQDKKHHAIQEREHLIEQAKEAWRKKQEGSKGGGESITSTRYAVVLSDMSQSSQTQKTRTSTWRSSLRSGRASQNNLDAFPLALFPA